MGEGHRGTRAHLFEEAGEDEESLRRDPRSEGNGGETVFQENPRCPVKTDKRENEDGNSRVRRFGCGQEGHYSVNCPHKPGI